MLVELGLSGWKYDRGFRNDATIDDLSLTLGLPDTNSIELLSGKITFGFASSEPASEPIPEPTTVVLLGIGIAGLAGVALRRRFKKVREL